MPIKKTIKKTSKLPYVIFRGTGAGVHAGELVSRNGTEVVLRKSRRLWYWKGAASLSELSQFGVKFPSDCKFGVVIEGDSLLLGLCELLPVTAAARTSIEGVTPWSA
ncbi:MAG: hypothetical protein ABFD89_17395 [Bryobacteraceae bacterium]